MCASGGTEHHVQHHRGSAGSADSPGARRAPRIRTAAAGRRAPQRARSRPALVQHPARRRLPPGGSHHRQGGLLDSQQSEPSPDVCRREPGGRGRAHQSRTGPGRGAGALRVRPGGAPRGGRAARLRRLGAAAQLPHGPGHEPGRRRRRAGHGGAGRGRAAHHRTGLPARPLQTVLPGARGAVRAAAARPAVRGAAHHPAAARPAAPGVAHRQPHGAAVEHRLSGAEAAPQLGPGRARHQRPAQRQEGDAGAARTPLRPRTRGRPHPAQRRGVPPVTLCVPTGYRVGAWEVGPRIATGAFAGVYAGRRVAHAPWLPASAALKFVPTGTSTPRQLRHLRELVEREVQVLSRVRRPRLIRMYETLTVDDPSSPELDGATVLVLERAERSLDVLLRRAHPAPPALLTQICEGLAQLHQAGWVHADLKPGNVLLMADGSVRLADFNLTAELDGTHGYVPAFRTARFTPPELLWAEATPRGHRIRSTADIWAFGMLAHLCLTGTTPLPGATPSDALEAAARYARGDAPLRLSPELPAAWRGIVADCLAPSHELRTAHDAESLLLRVARAESRRRVPRDAPRLPGVSREPRDARPAPPPPVRPGGPGGPGASGAAGTGSGSGSGLGWRVAASAAAGSALAAALLAAVRRRRRMR
ncbi:protein kinase [Streptomyces sp. SB3404]|uniref:Protein kinase n=1 Tax=Streptomyces boncukensis TaxID=2711219 RepID=A0A6G4WXM5_9ACTN|nr:protein kinase [Streptomyces boncukensis]